MPFPANIDLTALDGSNGFIVNGATANAFTGQSVSNAGDVNDDGIDDVVILAPYTNTAYVVFGHSGPFASPIDLATFSAPTTEGFAVTGFSSFNVNGQGVSSGDFNDDGIGDLLIGGMTGGNAYVLFGGDGIGAAGPVNVATLGGPGALTLASGVAGTGQAVGNAGDLNDDGVDDIVVASGSGTSYVVFGGDGLELTGTFDVTDINGNNGFVVNGDRKSVV